MMMPSADTVLDWIRQHPDGITIPALMQAQYGPMGTGQRERIRRVLYVRLCNLEKYELVSRTTIPARVQGGHITTWRPLP